MQKIEEKAVTVIRFCFFLLFALTPLIFTPCTFLPWRIIPCTFELFEFNKMMFVYALTTIIAASWLVHSVATKKFTLRRTPFDLPIILFLLSQTLSTIFSIERRTSLIGYYSRFHGGLFSTISYLILFYAFVTFMGHTKALEAKAKNTPYALLHTPYFTCILLLLTSASVVSAYGIAQHFGIDARFWVQDVRRRVFSTLGQPNWLAAFLIMVIPLTWASAIRVNQRLPRASGASLRGRHPRQSAEPDADTARLSIILYVLFALSYLALLYTKSRSGILGFALAYILFWGVVLLKTKIQSFPWKTFLIFTSTLLLLSFYDGLSWIPTIDKLKAQLTSPASSALATPAPAPIPLVETGGSDSGIIRKIVWQGALDVWRHYPIVGSGVETFAYSYYNFRPPAHNLVSEWDFLYNKAHNEYLNLLATTGLVGLGSYLLLQTWVFIWLVKKAFKLEIRNSSLVIALMSGLAGLSVSNFLGFSTVTVGLLSFLWPAIAVLTTQPTINPKPVTINLNLEKGRVIGLGLVLLVTGYLLARLAGWWYADTRFALGKQYEDASLPSEAYPLLAESVRLMPEEPNFRAELAKATADLAYLFSLQGASESAATMADISLAHSDIATALNPVHLNLIKARIRVLLTLNTFRPELTPVARATLDRGIRLAPTDPKLYYNLALLELKAGNPASAAAALQKTLDLKPNYEAARFAFGTFLEDQQKYPEAATHFQFILDRINPQNQSAIDHLKAIEEKSSLP